MLKPSFVQLSFFVCTVLVLTVTADDNVGMEKYRDYTPEQLRGLPEETIRNEVPFMITLIAQRGLSNGADLLFGMELNSLMYPGLHNFEKAVEAFQKDLGDEQTGILTIRQINILEKRAGMQKLGQLGFPTYWYSSKLDDLATVTGTVTILDERSAWPINHVKIDCNKKSKSCRWDQINVSVPDLDDDLSLSSPRYGVFESLSDFYDIVQWTENEIEATASGSCRTSSLSLNFKTREFYEITRNAVGSEACTTRLDKPRTSQVVDGEKIINEEFAKVQQAAFEVLASDFRKQVSKLISEEEAVVQKRTD